LERSLAEIEALPLTETTRRKWLGENAARFLNL
jgi:predicted TIM-barrel fold metal-dependent hydrolase